MMVVVRRGTNNLLTNPAKLLSIVFEGVQFEYLFEFITHRARKRFYLQRCVNISASANKL